MYIHTAHATYTQAVAPPHVLPPTSLQTSKKLWRGKGQADQLQTAAHLSLEFTPGKPRPASALCADLGKADIDNRARRKKATLEIKSIFPSQQSDPSNPGRCIRQPPSELHLSGQGPTLARCRHCTHFGFLTGRPTGRSLKLRQSSTSTRLHRGQRHASQLQANRTQLHPHHRGQFELPVVACPRTIFPIRPQVQPVVVAATSYFNFPQPQPSVPSQLFLNPTMSQQPATPVKVPSAVANNTPATLDPDLRSQINTVLLRDGHVTK